jgi:hypothetical protein
VGVGRTTLASLVQNATLADGVRSRSAHDSVMGHDAALSDYTWPRLSALRRRPFAGCTSGDSSTSETASTPTTKTEASSPGELGPA